MSDSIKKFLSDRGYSGPISDPIHREAVYWYRKVPGTDHHQVEVRMWSLLDEARPVATYSFDVRMTYETRNEVWATTKFYGLSASRLILDLERLESCMKQALLYMDANPLHYRFDGKS